MKYMITVYVYSFILFILRCQEIQNHWIFIYKTWQICDILL